jgi:hypothetical protein
MWKLSTEGLKHLPKKLGMWLTPIILTNWEAEIGRIMVQGQPGQIVLKTPSPK